VARPARAEARGVLSRRPQLKRSVLRTEERRGDSLSPVCGVESCDSGADGRDGLQYAAGRTRHGPRDELGRPIVTATVTMVSSPTFLAVPNPFAEPTILTMTTDDEGLFGVYWSHGTGYILTASHAGHLAAQVTLTSGYSTCEFVLVPEAAPKSISSNGHCKNGQAAEQ